MFLGHLRQLLSSGQVNNTHMPSLPTQYNVFPNIARSLPSKGLTIRVGAGNGYFGGHLASGAASRADSQTLNNWRLDFPSRVHSTLNASLSATATRQHTSLSNSGTAGYVCAGYSDTAVTEINVTNKFTFSSESFSTGPTWPRNFRLAPAFSNNQVAGYNYGAAISNGASGSSSSIMKIVYSSDTTSIISATATVARYGAMGWCNSGTAGYVTQGEG